MATTAGDVLGWVTALGVGGVGIETIRAFVQRKRMGADYAEVISGAAIRLLKPLEDQVQALQKQLSGSREEVESVRRALVLDLEHARSELVQTREELKSTRERLHRAEAVIERLRQRSRQANNNLDLTDQDKEEKDNG